MFKLILLSIACVFLISCGDSVEIPNQTKKDTYVLKVSNNSVKPEINNFEITPYSIKQAVVDFKYYSGVEKTLTLSYIKFSSNNYSPSCTADYEVLWGTEDKMDSEKYTFVKVKGTYQPIKVTNDKRHVLRFLFNDVSNCTQLSVAFAVETL